MLQFVIPAVIVLAISSPAQLRDDSLCRPTLAPRAAPPQVPDMDFRPDISRPAFAVGQGPKVLLDEAHFNFHTVEGRYAPFVKLLRRDGFVVEPLRNLISPAALAPARILVIANALAERNKDDNWVLPTPSAFTREEIQDVRKWVTAGGSLFLIADHMPFGGAAGALAAAFGILLTNGYCDWSKLRRGRVSLSKVRWISD